MQKNHTYTMEPRDLTGIYHNLIITINKLYEQFYTARWTQRKERVTEIQKLVAQCISTSTNLAICAGLNSVDIDTRPEMAYNIDRDMFDQDNKVIAQNLFMCIYNFGIAFNHTNDIEKFQRNMVIAYNFLLNTLCQFDIPIGEFGNAINNNK